MCKIPGNSNWDVTQLPFNRHMRRRVAKAKKIAIHLFSGDDQKFWVSQETSSSVVICAEIKQGIDMLNDHVMGWLEEVISSQRIVAILAGPPCRTVSVCRERGINDGGPRKVRSRTGPGRFGLPGLTPKEMELVQGNNLLWLRTLWLIAGASQANAHCESTIE